MNTKAISWSLLAGAFALVVACGSSEGEGGTVGGTSSGAPGDSGAPASDAPTFAKEIEPLVQSKCQGCHREGGIAPFALVTYDDVKTYGELARKKVETRTMPPWGAFDSDDCKMLHTFKDDLHLTDAQIALFGRWVDAGMPRGDASIVNAPPTFPSDNLATKTSTLQMAKAFEVPGGTSDDIRCFPIDPGFAADTWVSGVNVVPGNKKVVHHVIVYTDPQGEGAGKAGANGSYECFGGPGVAGTSLLMAWAPGVRPIRFDDAALKVKAGSKLVMQVHYHPTSDSQADQTGFELEIRPDKPANVAQMQLIGNARSATGGPVALLAGPNDPPSGPAFLIPANAKGHTETMEFTLPEKISGFPLPTLSLATVGAHMHWAGVNMKIEVERAPTSTGPAKECLLGTPKYDFNWQRGYVIDAPIDGMPKLQAGDKLRFTCTYDNTTDNPRVKQALAEQRLAAPVDISLGESTLDEMCLGVFALLRPLTLAD